MKLFKKIKSIIKAKNYNFNISYKRDFIKLELLENDRIILIDKYDNLLYNYFLETDIFEIEKNKQYLKLYYEKIYDIEEEDLSFFNLPEYFTGIISIDTKENFLNKNGVTFNYKITRDSQVYQVRYENIVETNLEKRILPKKQYKLIKEIIFYNENQKNIPIEQYKMFDKIDKIKEKTNILVSDYLNKKEELKIIENLEIDFIENKNGEIELVPVIESISKEENEIFKNNFKTKSSNNNFYIIEVDNRKIKIVINDTIKNTFKVIKKYKGKISKNNFINRTSPFFEEEIFEDENIILNYGPRVKGLGYLSYRPTAPVNNSEIDWFSKELPKIYTDDDSIILKPEILPYLKKKLNQFGKKETEDKLELEFNVNHELKKIFIDKDNLNNEINKLEKSIKYYTQYKKGKQLKEIIDLMKRDNKEYIEYDGNYIKNVSPKFEIIEEYLKSIIQNEKEDLFIKEKKKNKEKILLLEDNLEGIDYKEENDFNNNNSFKLIIPKTLQKNINLFEHQKDGIKKIQSLYNESKINGLLLSDDMGLGKTIQILVFLAYLKELKELTPSIIILPTSLISNWIDEIDKFFIQDTFKYKSIRGRINKNDIANFKNYDLILTSYETLRINHVKMGAIKWNVLICDEAQKIKNPKTLVTTAVKTQNAKFKIVSTATPIENTLQDLWCLVDLAKPGLLSSLKDFKKEYLNKRNYKSDYETNNDLQRKLGKSFIRRMKEDALNKNGNKFPKKIIKYQKIKPSEKQIRVLEQLRDLRDEGKSVLAIIQSMLMSCSHPKIISNTNLNFLSNDIINDLLLESNKLSYIKKTLGNIKMKNEKVIVFTKYKKMQKILSIVINNWFGFSPKIINGEFKGSDRRDILSEFKKVSGFNILILSPEAAGVGLNIIEANHVIHYTRHWNPAKEDQATDRVYRIGQKKDVYVYYPIVSFDKKHEEITFKTQDEWIKKQINMDTLEKSPEEKLNKLILKKKKILKDFFFAASTEFDSKELEKNILSYKITNNNSFIKIGDADNLKWDLFEALSVILLEKIFNGDGYLTNKGADSGIDGLIISKSQNILLQCKKSSSKITNKAYNELSGGKNIYEKELNIKFKKLFIVTNAEITSPLKNIQSASLVDIKSRKELAILLNKYKIKYSEIENKNKERYSISQLKDIF